MSDKISDKIRNYQMYKVVHFKSTLTLYVGLWYYLRHIISVFVAIKVSDGLRHRSQCHDSLIIPFLNLTLVLQNERYNKVPN